MLVNWTKINLYDITILLFHVKTFDKLGLYFYLLLNAKTGTKHHTHQKVPGSLSLIFGSL